MDPASTLDSLENGSYITTSHPNSEMSPGEKTEPRTKNVMIFLALLEMDLEPLAVRREQDLKRRSVVIGDGLTPQGAHVNRPIPAQHSGRTMPRPGSQVPSPMRPGCGGSFRILQYGGAAYELAEALHSARGCQRLRIVSCHDSDEDASVQGDAAREAAN